VTGVCPQLPNDVIRWIVPYSPGGGYDAYSRLIEPHFERQLNVEAAVINMAGAGGVVGAKALAAAAADGRTLGLINGSGLAALAMVSVDTPHPINDFTVIARLARLKNTWLTSPESSIRSMEDLFAIAAERPIIFGATDAGGNSFLSSSIGSDILGLDSELLVGYPGTRELALALIRGEFDVFTGSYDSFFAQIEEGTLRPVLQMSEIPFSDHSAFESVPVFSGVNGFAARRSMELGQDPDTANRAATALTTLLSAGRLVVAPPGLDPALANCLEDGLIAVSDQLKLERHGGDMVRFIDMERSNEVEAEFAAAADNIAGFMPVLQRALNEVRH
jgi:hypothetical protein